MSCGCFKVKEEKKGSGVPSSCSPCGNHYYHNQKSKFQTERDLWPPPKQAGYNFRQHFDSWAKLLHMPFTHSTGAKEGRGRPSVFQKLNPGLTDFHSWYSPHLILFTVIHISKTLCRGNTWIWPLFNIHTVLVTVIKSIKNLYSAILKEVIAAACIKNNFCMVKTKQNTT